MSLFRLETILPVSYTHLDVYKRQVFRLYVAPGVVYESYSMKVLPNSNSNFTVKTYSILPQSNVKVNLLHEALSRITESITDNGLQVYSDYYGRLDSGKVGEQKMLNLSLIHI